MLFFFRKRSSPSKITIPSELISAEQTHLLFRNSHAQERGHGYFREAIRFYHWPFHDSQQEVVEDGVFHRRISRVTASAMNRHPESLIAKVVGTHTQDWLGSLGPHPRETNLVNELRPIVLRSMYELLFDERLPQEDFATYLEGVKNFHDTLKGVAVLSRSKRLQLLQKVEVQIRRVEQAGALDPEIRQLVSTSMLARHYASIFFFTGVMQSVECITHTLTAVVQNPGVSARLIGALAAIPPAADFRDIQGCEYLDHVVKESLRLYPLFGRTSRQLSEAIDLGGLRLEKGSLLVLDFKKCHIDKWDHGERFAPERWAANKCDTPTSSQLMQKHYMPFGTGPRSCPAKRFSLCIVKTALVAFIKNVHILIPRSYLHTRRIPWGVPAVISRSRAPGGAVGDPSLVPGSQECLERLERRLPVNQDRGISPGLSIKSTFAEMMNNRRCYGTATLATVAPLVTGVQVLLFYLHRALSSLVSGRLLRRPAES